MITKLTRKALYDLVWSRPRTTLAKEMGVSDVWIGKQCRAFNVPAPPPGYWANRAAGGKPKAKYLRPPLTYTVAEHMQEDQDNAATGLEGFDAKDFGQVVPPAAAFSGTLEEAVARYTGLARAQAVRRRNTGPHPVVQRLPAEDERRAAQASPFSWEQPLYRGAHGRVILGAIGRIAWHWTDSGFRVAASGGRTIELSVSGAGQASRFEFRAAPAPKRDGQRGRPPTRTALEFWLDPDRDMRRKADKPALVFNTMDAATVDSLTALVITSWERRVREWSGGATTTSSSHGSVPSAQSRRPQDVNVSGAKPRSAHCTAGANGCCCAPSIGLGGRRRSGLLWPTWRPTRQLVTSTRKVLRGGRSGRSRRLMPWICACSRRRCLQSG